MMSVDYKKIITIEPGKRSGQPCIRGMRITVYDVLEYLAGGMSGKRSPSRFSRIDSRGHPGLLRPLLLSRSAAYVIHSRYEIAV